MSLSFRERERGGRGAPWSLLLVLFLVGAALAWRGSGGGGRQVPTLVEVVGEVPHPGTYALIEPTLASAIRAAGASMFAPNTPIPHGYRVVVENETSRIERPTDPLLVALPVDPNTASLDALRGLPGVGEATARKVILDREAHGPFRSIKDLGRVRGLRGERLEALRSFIAIEAVPPMALSTATAGELQTLPGIGPVLAERIVQERQNVGPFRSVQGLARVSGISAELARRLSSELVP